MRSSRLRNEVERDEVVFQPRRAHSVAAILGRAHMRSFFLNYTNCGNRGIAPSPSKYSALEIASLLRRRVYPSATPKSQRILPIIFTWLLSFFILNLPPVFKSHTVNTVVTAKPESVQGQRSSPPSLEISK